MPDRLELTKNVLFFKSNVSPNDIVIHEILKLATDNKEDNTQFIIDKFRTKEQTQTNIDYTFSIKVFSTVRPVHFLDDDNYEDRIYAYIILMEIDDYLVLLSKSCATYLPFVKESFQLIDVSELSKLVGKNADFQKISLRNMTVSEKAIRNRSFEASDLEGSFSSHSAGRSVPSYFKVREQGQTKSISASGRFVESSPRQSIESIVEWAHSQIQLIKNAKENEFLQIFAKKVLLNDVLSSCNPAALLIDVSAIEERIEDGIISLKYERKRKEKINGKTKRVKKVIDVPNVISDKLFLQLGAVYEIDSNLDIVSLEESTKINRNKKTLSIYSKLLRNFKIEENGKLESLLNYINKNGLFCLTFDNPRYMYCMESCFEDVTGVSEIDSILAMLYPQNNIKQVTSEKGEFSTIQEAFTPDSMFNFVEMIHSNNDYIFCDDLGDEWADHLTIDLKDFSINFIHSKYSNDETNSASRLQDVVGQGIKNLGNMHFSSQQILNKYSTTFADSYKSGKGANGKGKGVQTKISRIRKDAGNFKQDIDLILKNPKLHRKCILSCNFISKSNIEKELRKLQQGHKVGGHITQWLWILSSFSHAAKDAGVFPMIYCAA
ncbi:hypothetical protein [Acinetobacter beijerinckii]|uniref:Uncharacterized protein n=1 Tax=Acinetobacter beijerinckii ANC 3835 TaxID=1217649 RepID=N9FES7_9GAMM|nr:hypothetical protein [Acinetobacter beijerinckii]ENW03396.1 hypothetical protein F934_02652 [Acinetobacter beijerinckii ANC 3835]